MSFVIPNVVHCKKQSYTLYIGRPSKWGNPYSHKKGTLAEFLVESREEAVAKYEAYAREHLWDSLGELNGHVLGCWCHPLLCHGDILVKLFIERFELADIM